MGEAKQNRLKRADMVYHHTSTLRTNLLWMSGHILREGEGEAPIHPQMGKLHNAAAIRRPMKEFGPLVWLTRRIEVPQCLTHFDLQFVGADGASRSVLVDGPMGAAISLNRVALGFRIDSIGAVRWPDHPGYSTLEGRELNESALEYGDDPTEWYVCEKPVDIMLAEEFRASRRKFDVKLLREDAYLPEIKRMVALCRSDAGAYIPPTWMKRPDIDRLAASAGVAVR